MKRNALVAILLIICVALGFTVHKQSKLYNRILLPLYTYTDYKDYGWDSVVIEGTWVSDDPDQELGNQLSTVKFTCDKTEGVCREIQADASSGFLSIYTNESKITDWNDSYILADTTDSPLGCVNYFYRIDRFEKKLSARRVKNTAKVNDNFCDVIESKDWPLHLEDGFKVISNLRGYKQ